jgi:hypothetical protein
MIWQFLGILLLVSPVGLAISFFLIRRYARKQGPKQDGSTLEFVLAPGMQFLLGLVLVLLVAFTVLTLAVALSNGEGWYGAFIPLSVLVAIQLARPRRVLLDQSGIRQRRWMGGDREIAWSEVAWMKRGWRTGTTYVRSRNGGHPISFSPLLVGQSRFEREVRSHSHMDDSTGDSGEDE